MEEKDVQRYCFVVFESVVEETMLAMEREAISKENALTMEIYGLSAMNFLILDLVPPSEKRMVDVLPKLLEDFGNLYGNGGEGQYEELERIFKKNGDDRKISNYGGTRSASEYKRTVMTLELEPDDELVREYKRLHRPENIWPQILKNMDDIGVLDMEIYLKNYTAFLIMDTVLDFDMEKDGRRWANMPQENEWQSHVSQFQKTDATSKAVEKWKVMSRVFTT